MPKSSSIRKRHRAKGVVYEARYRDPEGRSRGKTFAKEAPAIAFLKTVNAQVQEGTWTSPEIAKRTFATVAEQWLTVAGQKVRPKTLAGYQRTLRLHVLPVFAQRQIGSITSAEVEAWLHGLGPVMPATVRHTFFPLQAVMRYAARHRIIRANPCGDVELPSRIPEGRDKVDGHFLSRLEVDYLAGELQVFDPIYGLLVRFAAGTGLRASEIAGLRIRDLRLAQRTVQVQRTVKKSRGRGVWVVEEPKTARSRRTVPLLDDDLVAALAGHLDQHPRRHDLDAPLWPGRDHVGQNYGSAEAPRYWDRESFYRNWFRPAVARVGLPAEPHTGVRFHDLRHTCGSQWLEDGHSMFDVSRWLGHSSIAFTDRVYAHVADVPDYSAAVARTRAAKAAYVSNVTRLPTALEG
jgi:integrase